MSDITIDKIYKLIHIRNYMSSIIESVTISSSKSHEINKIIPYLDKFIISQVTSDSFKQTIDYPISDEEKKYNQIKS
jgi:hypothetical protein